MEAVRRLATECSRCGFTRRCPEVSYGAAPGGNWITGARRRRSQAHATVAVISVLVWPQAKQRAEPTVNSGNGLSAAMAAAACRRLNPVWIARQPSQNARPML